MLMMNIMNMGMLMRELFMQVFMLVRFGEMEPDTNRHQHRGDEQDRRNTAMANTAPMNGAVEKYAPVRPAPSSRRARTNRTRLTPYPAKPTTIEPIAGANCGQCVPASAARAKFAASAKSPFSIAMTVASFRATFRVRLLSTPHARHAPAIRGDPKASGQIRGAVPGESGGGQSDGPHAPD